MRITTLLWMNDYPHDKIWGVIDETVTFWGRRGGQLTFKKDKRTITTLVKQKISKGYKEVSLDILPDGEEYFSDLKIQYIKTKLGDKYHGE